MKKVCFITTVPVTLRTFVLKSAEYIHENTDWDISFICDDDEEFAESLPEYIHYFPVSMKRGISIGGVKALGEIYRIFKRERFDMIQYSTPNASLYSALAGKFAGVPVRLYCQWGMIYISFSGIKRWMFKIIEKVTCFLSTWIEPDSHSNLDFAHAEGLYPEKKGSVIWNGSACGVDLEKFCIGNKDGYRQNIREQLSIPDSAVVYGFVGRITRDKGVNELLSAFKQLSANHDDCYLLMVGRNEIDDTVDRQLYEWSLESDRVIYAGYTTVVEQYLSAMDVYVLPSYREGFGMGVVEAEAMGVPVIVTDIPGPIDGMCEGLTGLKVKKADPELLRDAMDRMYKDAEMRGSFSDACRGFVEQRFEQSRLFAKVLEDRRHLMGTENERINSREKQLHRQ